MNLDTPTAQDYQYLGAMVDQMQSRFIRGVPTADVFAPLLVDLLTFTGCEYGLISEVIADPGDGHEFLRMHVLTDISWNEETRAMYLKHHSGEKTVEFHNLHTLLGAAVLSREPVIANDPSNDQRRGGLPHMHPPLNSYLGVPVFHGGEMVGLVGLANKEGGFHEALIGFFQPLYASVAAIIGAVRIDAARMQAEASLRQSEFEMRSTFEMAAVGMAHMSADGRFLRVNSQLADSLGLQEAALMGQTLAQFTHPDDREVLCQQFEQLVAGDVPRLSMQMRGLHAAGDDLLFSLCATQVCDASGKSGFVVAVIEDITARKKAETAMLAAQSAERANMAKTQFLSHMSHELRTPLNSVVGFSQLLQLDRSPPLSATQQAHARQIESAGSHLLSMINDLLDLSRIESGTVSISLESVDVRQSIDEAISLVSKATADARLRVDVLLPEGVMAERVEADRVRLRQVLVNLLSNAIKYNRPGGSVCVLVGPGALDDELAIEVKDTGHGMSPEQMGHLFDPFNRLGAERSHIEGTGIGLMITRGLIELMGGQLKVSSEAGVGSSFTIVLKLPAGHTRLRLEPGPSATDGPTHTGGAEVRLSVLYAEDNPTNVMLMKAVMEMRPQWRLVCATSGREALEVALSDPPDLVLLDMHLGDMTGLELLRQMRTHASLAALPCMVLSADALPESQRQAAKAGVLGYLTKPIDVPKFLAAMDAAQARL